VQRLLVVVQADERVAADQPVLEQAEIDRVGDRGEEHQGEHGHEGADELPARPGSAALGHNQRVSHASSSFPPLEARDDSRMFT
jgi:hypothetical protein